MGIPLATPPTQTPPTGDLANAVVISNLGTVANGSPMTVYGAFNATLSGTFSATARLEKSFDGGTIYVPAFNNIGSVIAATVPCSMPLFEPERGVSWRWACTVYSSGTIAARLSASGLMAQSTGPS